MARGDDPPKSVITCDLEGRIETFNKGAEALFGYEAEEVIGEERVSLFSPGEVVVGHVEDWLEQAERDGEFRTRTCFVRKDGSRFAAEIRITTTHRDGEHIGYCGQTRELEDVDPEEVMPEIGLGTKLMSWLIVTRTPFLTATIVPILVAAAWVWSRGAGGAFPWLNFGLALAGGCALHVAANCYNDYFDWESGTDQINNEYFQGFTGGSRAIELGLVSLDEMFWIATAAAGLAAVCGVILVGLTGPGILLFGLVGLFSAYFYTAPPLRLVARKGLGELLIGLNFGPLMTAGTAYALTGQFSWTGAWIGLPVGLLTAAILWINEFPDAPADERAGKEHLVVVLGKRTARWGYVALLLAAFGSVGIGTATGLFPSGSLLFLGGLPIAAYASFVLFRHWNDRELIAANRATILLQLVAGLLLAAGLFWNDALPALVG